MRPIRSLRTRVLAVLIGLLALGFVVIGTVTAVLLRDYQIGQLDTRLTAAGNRFSGATRPQNGQDGGVPWRAPSEGQSTQNQGTAKQPSDALAGLFPPGQGPGTLSAQVLNGVVTVAGVLDDTGTPQQLSATVRAALAALPADKVARTRDLGSLGSYRVIAVRHPSGDVLVTGLPMGDVNAAQYQLIGIELGIGLLTLLTVALGGAGMIRVALAPLTRVAAIAARVSRLPLHEGEVEPVERVPAADTDPRTEVGQVGAALNQMLDNVESALSSRQASETRLRRFVADASHELRTPLSTIRGYTELTHRHRGATPPEVSTALDRVEAATRRMTTLVEDLLLLARLDAKRPLEQAPVDLCTLLVDALTDAHVAGPDHRWLLRLPEHPVTVVGDQTRLHQVVANLLANARSHTPPGTTVTAGLVDDRSGARFWVVDDGPGIAPDIVPHVFERFARGDKARSRASGSSGLGLAIVDAVVTAHGGTVEVESSPGHTAFVVWIPRSNSQVTPSNVTQYEQVGETPLPA